MSEPLAEIRKDMFIRGGYNIYGVEVESVLSCHPGVVECAVVGQPGAVLGETIHAFVHYQNEPIQDAELKAFSAERLADYKIPGWVILPDQPLPHNTNRKLIKCELRAGADGSGGTA